MGVFFINTHSRSLPGDYDSGTMKSEYMHLLSPIIRPFREKKDEKKIENPSVLSKLYEFQK